jgi:hypothetical protein
MDLKTLMKDKKLLYGVGLAAAAGAAVFWQKSKSGTATSSGTTSSGTVSGTTYTGAGTVDTTGTDVASWLGSYSASLQSQLDEQNKATQTQLSEYEKSLTTAISGLGTMSNSSSPTDYSTINVNSGTWLTEVLRNNNLTLADLVKYNPDINTRVAESDNAGWINATNPLPADRLLAGERLSFFGDQTLKVPKK